jgi:hypothetical protein
MGDYSRFNGCQNDHIRMSDSILMTAPTRHPAAAFPNRLPLGLLAFMLFMSVLQGCRKEPGSEVVNPGQSTTADKLPADVAQQWSAMQLFLIRNTAGFTPPVAARAIGYGGLALYEAVVPGMPANQSMAGRLNNLGKLPTADLKLTYNWIASANAAQADMMRGLYATTSAANKTKIDSLETLVLNSVKNDKNTDELNRSVAFGKSIAAALFEWSKTDGGHEGYTRNFPTSFVPPSTPGTWRPTENGRVNPMQPYWGQNRVMVTGNALLVAPKPLDVSTSVTSPYFKQYNDVYQKNISLTQTEKEIAIWWADDPSETFTPPGHSYNLARIAAKGAKADLGKTAETLARVAIAVNDAFIYCWKIKYIYNNERPYTYVRRAIDPNWIPFWPAPPFPGYTSGHASQSAATAVVLTAIYGDNFSFTDDTHVSRVRDTKRGVDFKARSYSSFWATAEESALSRFLGGIHTKQDNDVGLAEGQKVGANVNALPWKR